MKGSQTISLRVDNEYRTRLLKTADKLGRSLSEMFQRALDNDLAAIHLEMAKKAQTLADGFPAGKAREKIMAICRESLDDAEFFRDRMKILEKAAPVYREIENLEAYRDFLRETVTVEA
jgi:predicted transcriptional regulator